MATRKRDIPPLKEKKVPLSSPSKTPTTHLRSTPNFPSSSKTTPHAQNHNNPTPPQKHNTPSYLRPTVRSSSANDNVPKQHSRKPVTPINTAQKPTHTKTRTSDKTPILPPRKTHVSTNPSIRSSSLPEKTVVTRKPVLPGKNLRAVNKLTGKNDRSSSYGMPVKKKSSTLSAKKEESSSNNTPHEKNVENLNVSSEDQESKCIVEGEEQVIQVVSDNEKVTVDLVVEKQEEPLDIEKTEDEKNYDDDKDIKNIVTDEPSPVLEQEEATLDIKAQKSDDELCIDQENSSKQKELEEHNVNEIECSNNVISENVADNYHPEDEEKKVEDEEKENVLDNKSEIVRESEGHESMEITEEHEKVEEKKQESENVVTKQKGVLKGKKDSVVSNDVIEETASKLREQRKNKVRALAGAFETVISLQ
ncbi:hypothetical protein DH2020_049332 [Rehmannia glutinosa]|uniref:Calmodulin-binding domain-containing protein n=1 Tax=Rehmannia glutinosa TaxID=99300 RepID=A0ABR0U3J8_REHGL